MPSHIRRPPYVATPSAPLDDRCELMLNNKGIAAMRKAGALARQALEVGKQMVAVGTTGEEIDEAVHRFIIEANAYPSPLRYHGFPKSCCVSVNEVVAHGIPNARPLEAGDILNIDVTVYTEDGVHGDCSETLLVPSQPPLSEAEQQRQQALRQLIAAAKQAMEIGIQQAVPGKPIRNIGVAIEQFAKSQGYTVFAALTGHGIGRQFHTHPYIVPVAEGNYPPSALLQPGMCITVEPILGTGPPEFVTWDDNWTLTTPDLSLSAQFEHTLLITKDSHEILTK